MPLRHPDIGLTLTLDALSKVLESQLLKRFSTTLMQVSHLRIDAAIKVYL